VLTLQAPAPTRGDTRQRRNAPGRAVGASHRLAHSPSLGATLDLNSFNQTIALSLAPAPSRSGVNADDR